MKRRARRALVAAGLVRVAEGAPSARRAAVLCAALGLVTVALIEGLHRTRRVAEDSAIGVVFPALFALGVLLISLNAAQVHIDTDCVLYGEIAFVPFNTISLGGVSLGPRSVWVLGTVTLLNLALVLVFWKELKLSTFDPALAAALGLAPVLYLHADEDMRGAGIRVAVVELGDVALPHGRA